MIYKKSRQRERILEILKSTGSHPTADWIYEKLKVEFPSLSMGTIYRNLNILCEQGFIKKIDFGSTYDRFDANIKPHYHFICEICGAIKDLELPVDYELEKKVEKTTHMKVHKHRIEFYGICDKCMEKLKRRGGKDENRQQAYVYFFGYLLIIVPIINLFINGVTV